MKIRIYGFEWFLGDNITLDEFSNFLIYNSSGKLINNRILGITTLENFYAGLFLTIKNIKAFCQMKNEKDKFIITPTFLEEQTKITEFNYFLLDKNTGRGLYQHYHQSASTNTFCFFCKQQYDKLKNVLIEKEINQLNNPSERQKQNIRKKYKGSLRYSTLLKPDSFENYIKSLKKISYFEFEFTTFMPLISQFRPLSKHVERQTYKMFFKKNSIAVNDIKKGILNIIKQGLRRGRVKGIDPAGNEVVYKLLNDYNAFAEYEYDEVIKTIKIDSDKLEESIKGSYLIKEMLKIAKSSLGKALLSSKTK